jgi:short chain dehydrogenase
MPSKLFAPSLLDGQLAIVSGGGSRLGRATALELAALGARVVVCGRRLEPLEETVAWAQSGIRLTALAAGTFGTDTLKTKYITDKGGKPLAEERRPRP